MVLVAASCAQDTGPHLASAMPPSASKGSTTTIAGERFCQNDCLTAAGEFVIALGADQPAVQLVVLAFADTSAQVMIPAAAPVGHAAIVLTVGGRSSNDLAFEVLP